MMHKTKNITGLLLVAGKSSRFGNKDKLLHLLPDGTPVGVASARNLKAAVTNCIAVIRPDNSQLDYLLTKECIKTVVCNHAEDGIGASIACGIKATSSADGWVITLGDMPFISSEVIKKIIHHLKNDSQIVRPRYKGVLGHPVGFDKSFKNKLLALKYDIGAQSFMQEYMSITEIVPTGCSGVITDIDKRKDVYHKRAMGLSNNKLTVCSIQTV